MKHTIIVSLLLSVAVIFTSCYSDSENNDESALINTKTVPAFKDFNEVRNCLYSSKIDDSDTQTSTADDKESISMKDNYYSTTADDKKFISMKDDYYSTTELREDEIRKKMGLDDDSEISENMSPYYMKLGPGITSIVNKDGLVKVGIRTYDLLNNKTDNADFMKSLTGNSRNMLPDELSGNSSTENRDMSKYLGVFTDIAYGILCGGQQPVAGNDYTCIAPDYCNPLIAPICFASPVTHVEDSYPSINFDRFIDGQLIRIQMWKGHVSGCNATNLFGGEISLWEYPFIPWGILGWRYSHTFYLFGFIPIPIYVPVWGKLYLPKWLVDIGIYWPSNFHVLSPNITASIEWDLIEKQTGNVIMQFGAPDENPVRKFWAGKWKVNENYRFNPRGENYTLKYRVKDLHGNIILDGTW